MTRAARVLGASALGGLTLAALTIAAVIIRDQRNPDRAEGWR